MAQNPDITRLLKKASEGDKEALDGLLPLVYGELRRLAGSQMSGERENHTLQPTALVHEAYLRLLEQTEVDWSNRLHFFSIAAEMMRRILVNHAIERKAQKRGSGAPVISIEDVVSFPQDQGEIDLVALDEAMKRLAEMDADQAKIVELKFFGGLTNEEIAEFTNTSISTVKREWASARAWLLTQVK
jgi:RNA polymerase sigma factor (TIGR02999 family)